ncbi:hypothetical protein L6164_026834 [Bauhinia variegata]|uniref:Uncharacterized protein n=1 Tax=Bauhinia variegata TaxID=167791 RepID=A0ACB9LRK4_BAUVA|nr:hypothetical protein L6164_026834 [Bauhinia variegata]
MPKSCGDGQNISFPFFIKEQPAFCGYPNFGLSCDNNGHPVLNLSNTNYTIQEILYQKASIRLSDAVFSISNSTGCDTLQVANNFTYSGTRFSLVPNQTEMFLFFGCNLRSLPQRLQKYEVDCSAENHTNSVLSLTRNDEGFNYVPGKCNNTTVKAMVEIGSVSGNEGILGTIKRGFLLKWAATNCSDCMSSGGRCGFDSVKYSFQCFCPDRPHSWKCDDSDDKKALRLGLGLGLGVGFPLIAILIIGCLIRQRYHKRKHTLRDVHSESRDTYPDPDPENGSVYLGFGVPIFSYKELQEATNNFHHTREVGDGGFGTVYYGKLRDGREVAVKRLYQHNFRRLEQFVNEVGILTRLRHTNLVSLYGCTSHRSRELLVVYEFIPNGTVACHLYGDPAKLGSLSWSIRMKIAIETASALAYLHASDIIHRDVKTNNILVDNTYSVKVADFGLSRLFPIDVTHVSTAPQGTPGYVDPDYHQCYQLTSKSDVYSFGVVLIELISSMPAVDMNRHSDEINLSSLAVKKIQNSELTELVDPSLGFDSDNEVKRMIVSVAELAFKCLQRDKELRPSMEDVLKLLKRIESGNNGPQNLEEADVHSAGISNGNVHPPPSPDCDHVGLLRNMALPCSPNTVIDKWDSKSTTPNAGGGIAKQGKCSNSFNCGNLGTISFPFTTTAQSNCGLLAIQGCDDPHSRKMIQQKNGRFYEVIQVDQERQVIVILDKDLQKLLLSKSCEVFRNNFTLPLNTSPMASLNISNIRPFYSCDRTLNFSCSSLPSDYTCPRYDIYSYYYFQNQKINCSLTPSSKCSMLKLPLVWPPTQPKDGQDFFNRLSANISIKVRLSDDCYNCHYQRGGQCRLDRNGSFYCATEKSERGRVFKLGLGGLGAGIIMIGCLILWCYKWNYTPSDVQFQSRDTYSDPYSNPDPESGSVYFGIPLFSYKELQEATNNFDLSRELGEGGFGTVYYGKLKDGREVAVKRLFEQNSRRVKLFVNEVEILTRLRHRNLVSLYGCTSCQSHQLLLVYEYIPNGTVASHLHAVDLTRSGDEINLADLAMKRIQNCAFNELIDPSLGFEFDRRIERMVVAVVELAFQCLQLDRESRPSMDKILEALKRIECEKEEYEHQVELDVRGAGNSHSNVHPPSPTSWDRDDDCLLKNLKLSSSPNTVLFPLSTAKSLEFGPSKSNLKFKSVECGHFSCYLKT